MDGYSDYEDSSENLSEPDLNDDDYGSSRYTEVDQLLVFGDPNSTYTHAASLDCRNSVDLREFGLEDSDEERRTRESTLLDLKAAARLSLGSSARHSLDLTSLDDELDNERGSIDAEPDTEDIDPSVQLRRRGHHHHHHHHHHHRGSSSSHNRNSVDARQSGGSLAAGPGFNFRFTDKWRSAPSLPASSLLDSLATACTAAAGSSSSSASLLRYDNYTRVASVPVNLDLCGRTTSCSSSGIVKDDAVDDDEYFVPDDQHRERIESSEERTLSAHDPEESGSDHPEDEVQQLIEEVDNMADILTMNHDSGLHDESDIEPGKVVGEEKARMKKRSQELPATPPSSVKVQDPQSTDILSKINSETPRKSDEENQNLLEEKALLTSTVKTQDRIESNVLEIAMAMENNVDAVVDEAIRQLRLEVEEATSKNSPNVEELTAALKNAEQMKQSIVENNKQRPRVRNNASYELAQHSTVDERLVRDWERRKRPTSPLENMKPLNNASYELAQHLDVMQNVSLGYNCKTFHRMEELCEEEPEPTGDLALPSKFKISELVDEMTGSASELVSDNMEYVPQSKIFSKSTENVSAARASRQKQQQQKETSLLDRIKKNSDFSPISGEDFGKDKSSLHSPSVLPALDDEVDYPCLLENKPIVAHNDFLEKTPNDRDTLSSRLENQDEEEEESPLKKTYIGEFYPDQVTPKSRHHHHHRPVSKSCEDVRNNRNGGGGAVQERLWRLVVEKEGSAGNGSTTRQRIAAPPPLDYYYAAAAESAAVNGGGGPAAGSSPASIAERDSTTTSSGLGASLVTLEHEEVFKEASTVQPRSAEMSATAAKRLAMSGEPLRSTSSMNALNTSAGTPKEERKKGGLGGFLSRFSKLRFSGRSKVPRSELQKKSHTSANSASGGANGAYSENKVFPKLDQQAALGGAKRRNEPDYIIIPLKPTEEEIRREEQLRQQQHQQMHQLNEEIRRPEAERNAPNVR